LGCVVVFAWARLGQAAVHWPDDVLSFLTPCYPARPRPVCISSGFGHSQGKLLLVAASSAVLVPPSPQRAPPHLFAIPRGLGVTLKLECAIAACLTRSARVGLRSRLSIHAGTWHSPFSQVPKDGSKMDPNLLLAMGRGPNLSLTQSKGMVEYKGRDWLPPGRSTLSSPSVIL